jgi:hypothetical protein
MNVSVMNVSIVVAVVPTDDGRLPTLRELEARARDALVDALDGEDTPWAVRDVTLRHRP